MWQSTGPQRAPYPDDPIRPVLGHNRTDLCDRAGNLTGDTYSDGNIPTRDFPRADRVGSRRYNVRNDAGIDDRTVHPASVRYDRGAPTDAAPAFDRRPGGCAHPVFFWSPQSRHHRQR